MAILADYEVARLVKKKSGEIIIDPYFDIFQGPNCYYLHLGCRFRRFKEVNHPVNPMDRNSLMDLTEEIISTKPITLKPQEFILAETFEYIGVSKNFMGDIEAVTSVARVGLDQLTAGTLNAGHGYTKPFRLTLELVNHAPYPIVLTPTYVDKNGVIRWGMEIVKIKFIRMTTPPEKPYDEWRYGVYSGDKKVSETKMYSRFADAHGLKLPKDSRVWNDKEYFGE
ncbi:hypothetical protein DRO02_01105 [archaeon]|nr:MAG: hypothetical protein DRO02_01105 [archaeon]RLG66028.1 MAG: hypothetical protein DRO21_00535 [archaeon]RLG66531.1 MAG: hypothetical protein DRN89_00685 [archaeon]HDM23780.1 hypothetical protein [Candidatus Bathyarchaeota archaeon]